MVRQSDKIKAFILKNVSKHPHDIVMLAMWQFHVTHSTVIKVVNKLVQQNKLNESGVNQDIQYSLPNILSRDLTIKTKRKDNEFFVYKSFLEPLLQKNAENIVDIFHYGFTEILNNAFEHANAKLIKISFFLQESFIVVTVQDDGIGIFKNIANHMKLTDFRESILHLSKGKFTTKPQDHTGEGLFFSSKMFDNFSITANGILYGCDNQCSDWFIDTSKNKKGTTVTLKLSPKSKRQLTEIFQQYQVPDSLNFSKTHIRVALGLLHGESLISRSQAKRILRGLEKFTHIILDFDKVRIVGQGFVDQIFRVYKNQRPEITLEYIHALPDVEFMIERGLSRMPM